MSQTPNQLENFVGIFGAVGRTVTITNIAGQDVTISTLLPARKQFVMAERLARLLEHSAIRAELSRIQEVKGEPVAAIVRFVSTMVSAEVREEILSALDEIMELVGVPDATNQYEIQEVVKALIPFAARPLSVVSTVAQRPTAEA